MDEQKRKKLEDMKEQVQKMLVDDEELKVWENILIGEFKKKKLNYSLASLKMIRIVLQIMVHGVEEPESPSDINSGHKVIMRTFVAIDRLIQMKEKFELIMPDKSKKDENV